MAACRPLWSGPGIVARSVPEGIRGLRLSERVSVLKGIRMLDRLRDRPWRSREVVWRPILHFKHILLIGGFGPSVPRNIEAWRDLESTLLGYAESLRENDIFRRGWSWNAP